MTTELESPGLLTESHIERLNLNYFGLRRRAKELKRDGIITRGMSRKQAAEILAASVVADNPEEFESCRAEDGRDWEAFFTALVAFLEKLMPLIMLFL